MSYDASFAGILALGESDEEDPVFEIGCKIKKKHSKAKSDEFKVTLYTSFLVNKIDTYLF